MRKLVIALAVLVSLLVVADRVGAAVAAHVVAKRLQTVGSLSSQPEMTIRGFPFLTQALGGRYDRIELTAHDLKRRAIRLDRLDVTVTGARVAWRDALAGHVGAVPVEALSAKVVVSYADIASRSGMIGATLEPAGREVLLTGRLKVLGQTVVVRTLSTPRLDGTHLVLSPRIVDVSKRTPDIIRAITRLIEVRIDIGTLPYGLRLTAAKVTSEGIVLSALSGPTVLQRR